MLDALPKQAAGKLEGVLGGWRKAMKTRRVLVNGGPNSPIFRLQYSGQNQGASF